MFFGSIENPKNEKLPDLNWREWAYMTPLVVLSLWIGCYPKPFIGYIQKPVDAIVRQLRPTYPIPGLPPGEQRAVTPPANPQGNVTISPPVRIQPR